MTAKPPNTPVLSPDAQSETTATVTFDQILDSSGISVGRNTITFDNTLTFKGTAGATTELWIRDGVTRITSATSSGSGTWITSSTLLDFKRYRFTAIEKSPPQDYSTSYVIVLATETPIIDKVIGKDGQIENGGTYNGDSLEFSGYAPPNMEVEAFNGNTSTDKKTTVNGDGLFNLTLDGLTVDDYSIKIKAANGKESGVFAFKVVFDVDLSLDDVVDSNGSIAEGGETFDDKVTVSGYARPGEEVQLRNNNARIDNATDTARDDDGFWEIVLDVTPNAYSLTVEALYGDGEISAPPRTFKVESIIKPRNTRVLDRCGQLIDDHGSTPYNYVIVRGDAAESAAIKLKINGVTDPEQKPEPTNDKGMWARLVPNLVNGTTYEFIAVADYGDNAESNAWTITIEE
ncbi:Ig-like domain repeat protein [Pseudomonas sp. IT-196MI5]|uniref:carboxypeptidase regulatory-like domain-containing protein n=1 Tax=unclassified Pseudomonas TaxID=196821 RepID=UPI0039E00FA7